LIVAFTALVAALGGIAYGKASAPSVRGDGQIDACLALPKRLLYVPPHGSRCHPHDLRISWTARGERGTSGSKGPAGERGEQGIEGLPGESALVEGGTVLNGTGPPDDGEGREGDFYVDTTGDAIYGPKTKTTWAGTGPMQLGAGARGPQGPAGPQGKEGKEGREGRAGAAGSTGPAGSIGATGAPGGTGATGPSGSPGVGGARGAEGPKGEQGDPGISGYEVLTKTNSQTVAAGETVELFAGPARCPGGRQLLGGGVNDSAGTVLVDGPQLEGSTPTNAWEAGVLYRNESGEAVALEVTAVAYCANVSS
jgi:hypothetical protein